MTCPVVISPSLAERRNAREARRRPWREQPPLPVRQRPAGKESAQPSSGPLPPFPLTRLPYDLQILILEFAMAAERPLLVKEFLPPSQADLRKTRWPRTSTPSTTTTTTSANSSARNPKPLLDPAGRPIYHALLNALPENLIEPASAAWYRANAFEFRNASDFRAFVVLVGDENMLRIQHVQLRADFFYGTGLDYERFAPVLERARRRSRSRNRIVRNGSRSRSRGRAQDTITAGTDGAGRGESNQENAVDDGVGESNSTHKDQSDPHHHDGDDNDDDWSSLGAGTWTWQLLAVKTPLLRTVTERRDDGGARDNPEDLPRPPPDDFPWADWMVALVKTCGALRRVRFSLDRWYTEREAAAATAAANAALAAARTAGAAGRGGRGGGGGARRTTVTPSTTGAGAGAGARRRTGSPDNAVKVHALADSEMVVWIEKWEEEWNKLLRPRWRDGRMSGVSWEEALPNVRRGRGRENGWDP